MTTLAEQLGMRPTKADANTASVSLPRSTRSSTGSPTVSKMPTSTSVTKKMKTLTCTV